MSRPRKAARQTEEEVRDAAKRGSPESINPSLVCKAVSELNSSSGSTFTDIMGYLMKNELHGRKSKKVVENKIRMAMCKSIHEGLLAKCDCAPRYKLAENTRNKSKRVPLAGTIRSKHVPRTSRITTSRRSRAADKGTPTRLRRTEEESSGRLSRTNKDASCHLSGVSGNTSSHLSRTASSCPSKRGRGRPRTKGRKSRRPRRQKSAKRGRKPRKASKASARKERKNTTVAKSRSSNWLWERFMGGGSKSQKKANTNKQGNRRNKK